MLPQTKIRIKISDDLKANLIAEKSRTGLGPAAILRYAKALGLRRRGCRLDAGILATWFSGASASAYQHEIDSVLAAYGSITGESGLPSEPHQKQLIIIDASLNEELQGLLKKRPNSNRRIILSCNNPPRGLNENRLLRLATGRDTNIQLSHLSFIRTHFTN